MLGTEILLKPHLELIQILLQSYLNYNFNFIITCACLVLKGILKLVVTKINAFSERFLCSTT